MPLVLFLSILATGLAGILIKFILEARNSDARISWREYAIGMICAPVLSLIAAYAGWTMARSSNMTFSEYLNGWESAAIKSSIPCSRDGPCRWEYDCDPYSCSYECGGYEGTGNNRRYVSKTCWKTCYHSCPYVDTEYSYSVATTVGSFTIAGNVFPPNPQNRRWRWGASIPSYIINRAGVGDPPFWAEVKKRCDADSPGPATAKHDYPNYILASEHTLMKQYSGDIQEYRKNGLLPDLPQNVYSFYWADKVRFVGFNPSDAHIWRKSLEYLNAALGNQRQGDVILVIVKNNLVANNPERYSFAVKAFWQDKTINKHNALPKNAIVIILGTEDEKTISWSRGFTAMPLGNEGLTTYLRDGFKGLLLDPEVIIGPAKSYRDNRGVQYPPPEMAVGALPKLLWGLENPATKFTRVSMSGKDGKGGFLYLKGEIQPTSGQTWAIFFVAFIISSAVWIWAAVHYDPSERKISFSGFFRKNRF